MIFHEIKAPGKSTAARATVFGTVLGAALLLFVFILYRQAAGAPNKDEWGSPCPSWHPDACYSGTNTSVRAGFTGWMQARLQDRSSPLAVEMLCFYAEGGDGVVSLEWQTATEMDTNGFDLYRSQSQSTGFVSITNFIIHCDDTGIVGGYYQFEDRSVSNGTTYFYKLVETTSDMQQIEYGPLMVIPGPPTLTFTPSSTPTASQTPKPSKTPTPNEASTSAPRQPSPSKTSTFTASPTTVLSGVQATPTPTVRSTTGGSGTSLSTTSGGATIQVQATIGVTEIAQMTSSTPDATEIRMTAIYMPVGGSSGAPENTPDMESETTGSPSGYPLDVPAPYDELEATGYPFAIPTNTPPAEGYVPPPTRVVSQLATMTPLPVSTVTNEEPSGQSRAWLLGGFIAAVLILAGSLYAISGRWQRQTTGSTVSRSGKADNSGEDDWDQKTGAG